MDYVRQGTFFFSFSLIFIFIAKWSVLLCLTKTKRPPPSKPPSKPPSRTSKTLPRPSLEWPKQRSGRCPRSRRPRNGARSIRSSWPARCARSQGRKGGEVSLYVEELARNKAIQARSFSGAMLGARCAS